MQRRALGRKKVAPTAATMELPPGAIAGMAICTDVAETSPAAIATIGGRTKMVRGVDLTAAPRMEMSRGGGAQGGSRRRVTSCAQASQWGLRVSPGKGLGTFERFRDGEIGCAVVRRSAAGSDGHSQWSIRHSHTRAININ